MQEVLTVSEVDDFAESALLGYIILTGERIAEVVKHGDDIFVLGRNKEVYKYMKILFEKKISISITTLVNEYKLFNTEESVEPFENYLIDIANRESDIVAFESMLELLIQCRMNKLINDKAEIILKTIYTKPYDWKVSSLSELADYARNLCKDKMGVKSFEDIVLGEAKRVDSLIDGKFLAGQQTFYEPFDKCFGLMRSGETYLIGGAPKMGKTTLIINAIKRRCKNDILNERTNKRILMLSCESDGETISRRMIASELRVSESKLFNDANIYKKYAQRIEEIREEQFRYNLDILSISKIDIAKLRALIAIQASDNSLAFVVIDHFGKLEIPKEILKNYRTEREQYIYIGLCLQEMAQDYDIPIIVLIHTTKDTWASGKDKIPVPSMTWFADYGALSKNCAGAMIVQRDYEYDKGVSQFDASLHNVFSRFEKQGNIINIDCNLDYAHFGNEK